MDNDIKNLIQQEIKNYFNSSQYNVSKIPSHVHNGADTAKITVVDLPIETPIRLGLGGLISTSNSFRKEVAYGAVNEQIQTSIASGKDQAGTVGITTKNLQFNLFHQPQNAANQSFITAFRPPIFGTPQNTTISTTLGGNTVTVSGYGFVVDELAGGLINIFDSSGTFIESQTIASNTASVITITGTWLATTAGGTFYIYQPVFLGSADTIWQRFYTQEGTGGGIRFGVGTTGGGQNGLLYMDATGNIYWRDKANAATKLNGQTSEPTALAITRDLAAASGTVNTAHGMATTPTFIRATVYYVAGSGNPLSSFGTWDGTNIKTIYFSMNGATPQANTDSTNLIACVPVGGSDYQLATVSADATNVSLSWTKTGSPTGNAYIILECL